MWPYQTMAGRAVGDRAPPRHSVRAAKRQRVGKGKRRKSGPRKQALRDTNPRPRAASSSTRAGSRPARTSTRGPPGLRLAPSTIASYRKNIRLHIAPVLRQHSAAVADDWHGLTRLYRELERGGRADHRQGEGLSPRTVRYVHTILSAALSAAVQTPGGWPATRPPTSSPPTCEAGEGAGDAPVGRPGSWPRSWPGLCEHAPACFPPLWHAARVHRHAPRRGPGAALVLI